MLLISHKGFVLNYNAFVLTDVVNIHARADEVVSFSVHETGEMRKEYTGVWIGVVRPKLEWHTELKSKGAVIA